jgi:DNA-binding MarR family transcriptional regulator
MTQMEPEDNPKSRFLKSPEFRNTRKPSESEIRKNDEILTLTWALRAAARAARTVDSELGRRLGVSQIDARALELVSERDGVGPSGLACELGITSSSVTDLIDRLHAAGHLNRYRDPLDRRRIVLHLTLPTRRQFLAFRTQLRSELRSAAAALTPSERRAVGRYLRATAVAWHRFGTATAKKRRFPAALLAHVTPSDVEGQRPGST